jgi:cell division protein FtsB
VAVLPKLTARAIIVLAVAIVTIVALLLPTRSLIQERRESAALQAQITAGNAKIEELQAKKKRLLQPEYVATLARARLNYVFPGEVGYVVLDEETSTKVEEIPGALVPNDNSPWYSKLWESTQLADTPHQKNDPLVVAAQ